MAVDGSTVGEINTKNLRKHGDRRASGSLEPVELSVVNARDRTPNSKPSTSRVPSKASADSNVGCRKKVKKRRNELLLKYQYHKTILNKTGKNSPCNGNRCQDQVDQQRKRGRMRKGSDAK